MSEVLRKIMKKFEDVRKKKMKLYWYEKLIIICFFIVWLLAVSTGAMSKYFTYPEWVGQVSAWSIVGAVVLIGLMVAFVSRDQRPQYNEMDLKAINEILKLHGIHSEADRILLKEMINNSNKGKEYHPVGTRFAFDLLVVPILATMIGSFVEEGWLINFEAGRIMIGAGMELYLSIILLVSLGIGIINICNIIGSKGKAVRIDLLRAIDEINCWEKIVNNIKK